MKKTKNRHDDPETVGMVGGNGRAEHVVSDGEEALERATDAVLTNAGERVRRKNVGKYWGDRPEHLRKPISEMTPSEKAEYYRWKAAKEVGDEPAEPVYTESDLYAVGLFLLPLLNRRLPNPVDVTEEEYRGFAKAFTPLANKYVGRVAYKEEIAGLLFVAGFVIPRLKLFAAS